MPLDIDLNLLRIPPQISLKVDSKLQARCHDALRYIAEPPWVDGPMTESLTMILFKRRIALGRMLQLRDSRITPEFFPDLFAPGAAPGVGTYAGQEARLWLAFYDLTESAYAEGQTYCGMHPMELLANCIEEMALLMPEAQRRPKGHKQTLSAWCGAQNRTLETDLSNPFDPETCPVTCDFVDWAVSRCQNDSVIQRKWYELTKARSNLTRTLKLGSYTIVGDKIEARGRKGTRAEASIKIKRKIFTR